MPISYIIKTAKEKGISVEKAEEYWKKAKEIAKVESPDTESDNYWAYVIGVYKRIMNIKRVTV